jgi:hypothetical protein
MDELLVLLFRLIVFILKLVGRLLWRLLQALGSLPGRAERGGSEPAWSREPDVGAMRARPTGGQMQPKPASQMRDPRREGADVAALGQRLDELSRRIATEASRYAAHVATRPLAEALERHLTGAMARTRQRLLQKKQEVVTETRRIIMGYERLLDGVARMAAQRRDPALQPVLEMADRLAMSSWEQLRRHAAGAGASLEPARCVAVLGGASGLLFSGFDDVRALGVAPLVLPLEWATEPAVAPALVHELGHRLYGGLAGLEAELRAGLGLSRAALAADRSRGSGVKPLLAAWLEELWVDTVGVMMLGSAYVRGMMWVFGSEETPQKVIEYRLPGAVLGGDQQGGGMRYDEHPPAHLRVLLACHTLTQLGEVSEAEACEAEWRDRHDSPEAFYIWTSIAQGLSVEEAFLREPGQALVTALRERSWASLGLGAGMSGRALGSLPGLGLGPRERRAIEETVAHLVLGRQVATRDARVLMAGMVRARFQEPMAIPRILEAVRATVRMWGGQEQPGEGERAMAEEEDGDPVRDALLLAALLPPPPSLRRRWPS